MYIEATHLKTRLTHIPYHSHLPLPRFYNPESAIATVTHPVQHL